VVMTFFSPVLLLHERDIGINLRHALCNRVSLARGYAAIFTCTQHVE
jgi:hypothetical protein